MLRRILGHMRQNVVAYIALFFAMGGTTAWATHEQIFSSDIVDGEVKSVDIGPGEVGSSDVKDNSLNTFDVHSFVGADVVDGSLTGLDVQNHSLGWADISAGSQTLVTEDPDPVPAHSCNTQQTAAITGKTQDDFVFLFPPPAFPPGLVLANARDLNDTSQASYRLCNVTNAEIDAGSIGLGVLVIRV